MNQRPTGVTILAILAFIGGAFGILGALALLGLGVAFAGVAGGGLSFIFGIVFLALSILYLVVFGAGIVISFIELLLGYASITNLIVTIVINGLVIYYLLTPGVKAAFGVEGDLQTAVMTGLPMGGGTAAAAAPPAAPAEPPAAAPPAAPAEPPAAPPPASTWGGESTSGSSGADDSDRNP
jgi:hypothetical protein